MTTEEPRLQIIADGQPVPIPPASEGNTSVIIESLGVKVTFEMTPEGMDRFFEEIGVER